MAKSTKRGPRTKQPVETPFVRVMVYIFTALSIMFAAVAYALYW